jgi:hypothetical protein
MTQIGLQFGARFHEVAAGRAFGYLQGFGYLLVGVPLYDIEIEHGSVYGR